MQIQPTVIDAIIWLSMIAASVGTWLWIEYKNHRPVGIKAIKQDIANTREAMKTMDKAYSAFVDALYEEPKEDDN